MATRNESGEVELTPEQWNAIKFLFEVEEPRIGAQVMGEPDEEGDEE